jgi:hypothetical protein
MSVAPAGPTSMIVAVSGVLQDPSTYAVVGTTLNFTTAPPVGSGNISVRYLGIPASGVTTTAYRTATEFTATAGQTTFTPPSYTVGYLDVYRNGVLLGSADYTATNGTTVVLAVGCVSGDLVETISFLVSSVLNAIPNTAGSISSSNLPAGLTIVTPTISSPTLSNATVTGTLTTSSSGVTFSDGSTQTAAASPYVLKNRIINGAMVIDQRNAGASTNVTNSQVWMVDRWWTYGTQNSKLTAQQSSVAPAGFNNSVVITSSSSYSVLSTDIFQFAQRIEGYNVADLGWGTSDAKTITVSFWVRSSLTGTFSGSIGNASDRSYCFNYTINTANTWEQKTITVTGDTTGTWNKTNAIGLSLSFNMGQGSTYNGTLNTWTATNTYGTSGSTNIVGTNGATFYITGVQLEQNTSATPFERRLISQELANCQRYYEIATIPTSTSLFVSYAFSGSQFNYWQFKVTKRTSPTTLVIGPSASWVGATASLFSGAEAVQLYHPTTGFYIGGTAGVVAITASAEL